MSQMHNNHPEIRKELSREEAFFFLEDVFGTGVVAESTMSELAGIVLGSIDAEPDPETLPFDYLGVGVSEVGPASEYLSDREPESTAALVHFTPENVSFAGSALLEKNDTQIATTLHSLLLGMGTYMASVKAGILPRPDFLVGDSNREMAAFAIKRLGFELLEQDELEGDGNRIVASWDAVEESLRGCIDTYLPTVSAKSKLFG